MSSDDGGETTTGTAAEITVGSNALTSINKNEKVKEVELKTDVGTLTISDAAWNDMTAKATEVDKTASVVIKLEDKSKEGATQSTKSPPPSGKKTLSTVAAMAL